MADFKISNEDLSVPQDLRGQRATITYYNDVTFTIDFHGTKCHLHVSFLLYIARGKSLKNIT